MADATKPTIADSTESFDFNMLMELFSRAEPRLRDLMREKGAEQVTDLDRDTAGKLMRIALLETAARVMPETDLATLDRSIKTFLHPAFAPAFSRLTKSADAPVEAFELTYGSDAAVFLAGAGLAVLPLDKRTALPLADASDDIDVVLKQFRRFKTSMVGFSSCHFPFYILVTDCVRTAMTTREPALAEVRTLFARGNVEQRIPDRLFQHGCVLFARMPGDKISTVAFEDSRPQNGSVLLYAGWLEGERPCGAPNGGFAPVPIQLIRGFLKDPQLVSWMRGPSNTSRFVN